MASYAPGVSIEANVPDRAYGGVSRIVGRTSDGMAMIFLSTTNLRMSLDVELLRNRAVPLLSDADSKATASLHRRTPGWIRRAVSTKSL